jgi:hypothetical protein
MANLDDWSSGAHMGGHQLFAILILSAGLGCRSALAEKRAVPMKHEEPKSKRGPPQRAKVETAPSEPQASGQIFCNGQGCRAVKKGCHLEPQIAGRSGTTNNEEVCN